jgi:hypothetical protein
LIAADSAQAGKSVPPALILGCGDPGGKVFSFQFFKKSLKDRCHFRKKSKQQKSKGGKRYIFDNYLNWLYRK